MSEDEKHVANVALKSLELARAEILERIRFRYQALTVYSLAVGGIFGFVLKDGKAATQLPIWTFILFVLSVLSLTANWTIYHNETGVNHLARFQVNELAGKLRVPRAVIWETSHSIQGDSPLRIALDTVVQSVLTLSPPLLLFIFRPHLDSPLEWSSLAVFVLSVVCALAYVVGRIGLRYEQNRATRIEIPGSDFSSRQATARWSLSWHRARRTRSAHALRLPASPPRWRRSAR